MKLTPTTRFTAIIQVALCYLAPPVKNWGIFGAKFYCPHALAGRNHRSWIWGEDAGVLLSNVIGTHSVPLFTAL